MGDEEIREKRDAHLLKMAIGWLCLALLVVIVASQIIFALLTIGRGGQLPLWSWAGVAATIGVLLHGAMRCAGVGSTRRTRKMRKYPFDDAISPAQSPVDVADR